MNPELTRLFMETGLVQFGRFPDGNDTCPFRLNLDYLPAYPDVLRLVVQAAQQQLEGLPMQRLVATAEAVPLGVALSLASDVSLVYSRGSTREAVYDLAGAYNIGHAAVLVTNMLDDPLVLHRFITAAQRVGLEIHTLLALLDLETGAAIPDVSVLSILTLPGIVRELVAQAQLPPGQGQAVEAWLAARRVTLRPGAASP